MNRLLSLKSLLPPVKDFAVKRASQVASPLFLRLSDRKIIPSFSTAVLERERDLSRRVFVEKIQSLYRIIDKIYLEAGLGRFHQIPRISVGTIPENDKVRFLRQIIDQSFIDRFPPEGVLNKLGENERCYAKYNQRNNTVIFDERILGKAPLGDIASCVLHESVHCLQKEDPLYSDPKTRIAAQEVDAFRCQNDFLRAYLIALGCPPDQLEKAENGDLTSFAKIIEKGHSPDLIPIRPSTILKYILQNAETECAAALNGKDQAQFCKFIMKLVREPFPTNSDILNIVNLLRV